MKRLTTAMLPLIMMLPFASHAQNLKTAPIVENGTTTAYVSVPSNARCNIQIPDVPTAFCATNNNHIYHLSGTFIKQQVNPQQLFNSLLQQLATDEPGTKIVNKYTVPEITQHMANHDSQLIFKSGQQVVTYAIDVIDSETNEKSSAAFVISSIPNNGAPATNLTVIGFTAPISGSSDFSGVRAEMIRFARSYQYDRSWIQSANAQHMQFLNNQTAKNNAFAARQNQIHQSNMNALDNSFNSHMRRSAISDQGHDNYMNNQVTSGNSSNAFIDSIHEREQMIDTSTGQRYVVEGYYDHTYVNPNDSSMFIQSNDPTFNPNVNLNQGENFNQLQPYNY